MNTPFQSDDDVHQASPLNASSLACLSEKGAGDSFPVLKAFQEYIDAERAQSRRRIFQLSIFFIVILIFVVAGFLAAGMFVVQSMATTQNRLWQAAFDNKQQQTVAPQPVIIQQPAVAMPQQPVQPVTQQAMAPVLEELSKISTSVASVVDAKLDASNADLVRKMEEQAKRQKAELEAMKAEMNRLKIEANRRILYPEHYAAVDAAKKGNSPTPSSPTTVAAPTPPPAKKTTVKPTPAASAEPFKPISYGNLADDDTEEEAPASDAAPRVVANPVPAQAVPANEDDEDAIPPPAGMSASALQLKVKDNQTIPWRIFLPE